MSPEGQGSAGGQEGAEMLGPRPLRLVEEEGRIQGRRGHPAVLALLELLVHRVLVARRERQEMRRLAAATVTDELDDLPLRPAAGNRRGREKRDRRQRARQTG